MAEKVERRLAAILSADVVGFSKLMEDDEAGTLARLKAHRAELFDPITRENGGRIVKLMGDGVLVEFPSVVDAVHCAVEVQSGIAERNGSLAEFERIALRIGVNLGDVIIDGEDIYGEGVNIAARLQGLAAPGGVSVSGKVYDEVRGKVDAAFEDLGEKSVKNIAQPIRVYAITSADKAVTTSGTTRQSLPLPSIPSIAVLPFDNLSGDPEQEYFADGVADDIITELSRLNELFVIARNSSFTYKDRTIDIRTIGRELGVRYVLEGSVRRGGARLRVSAQLIDSESGNHIWAEKYDGPLQEIFDFQDSITESVTGAIVPSVFLAEMVRARRKRPENLDAYDLVLRGWSQYFKLEPALMAEARNDALKAIEIDTALARAHVLLSATHLMDFVLFWSAKPEESLRSAIDFAQRAVQLDEWDAAAHVNMCWPLLYEHRHDVALAEAERAVTINPNLATARSTLAAVYTMLGRHEEGAHSVKLAMRLSPRDPHMFVYLNVLTMCEYNSRDYESSANTASRLVALKPDYIFGYWQLATSCAQLGQTERAQAALREVLRIFPNLSLAFVEASAPYKEQSDLQHMIEGLRKAGWEG